MKTMEGRNNVTDGDMLRSFIAFTIPLVAAGCLQQSYTIADGLILGNFINQEALGAVSSCSSIIDVCTLVQIGIAGGCSIVISHLIGAEKHREVRRLISEITRLVLFLSVVIAAAVFIGTPWILRLLHTPDSLFRGAALYLRISFTGVPGIAMYSLLAGILRGMGDSKRPLGGIAVSSGVNIALDLLFIAVLRFGIAGAAVATVTAEYMSAIYLFIRLTEKRKQQEISGDAESDEESQPEAGSHLGECISLGAPQILQSVAVSGGKVLLQNITNILGAAVVIGVAAAYKIDSLLLIPVMSIGTAVAVFSGQNIGAGKFDRVRLSLKYGLIIAAGISIVMTVILWVYGYPMMTMFGLDGEAAAIGYRYLLICLPFYWIFGMQFVLGGYLNGSKHTVVSSAASIAGLAVRVAAVYLGYSRFGSDILPAAEAMAWITGAAIDLAAICYFRGKPANSTNR